MKRNYIGASHVEPWRILAGAARPKAGSIDSDNTGIVLGFRLAHDSDSQVIRGSIFGDEARVARSAVRGVIEPGLDLLAGSLFGFRLTRDEEAT